MPTARGNGRVRGCRTEPTLVKYHFVLTPTNHYFQVKYRFCLVFAEIDTRNSHGVVVDNRAAVGVSAWAVVVRSTAGRLALSKASDGCRVQRVLAAAQALTRNRRSVILHP